MAKPDSPMPEISAFVEALRDAFNAIVRRGRAGEPVFFAREAGREFGTPLSSGSGWGAEGVRNRHYCLGRNGECVATGARCSDRRAGARRNT